MSDNKRVAETDIGDCAHEAKKAKIDDLNGEIDTENKAQKIKDNNGKSETNNDSSNEAETDKPKPEVGTNGATDDHQETNDIDETSKEAVPAPNESDSKSTDNSEEEINGASEAEPSDQDKEKVSEKVENETVSAPPAKKSGEVSGEFLIAGCMNWDFTGRRPKDGKPIVPTLWGPNRLEFFKGKQIRSVHSGPCAAHNVVVDDEGQAYVFGRNDNGQLGNGNTKRVDVPIPIDSLGSVRVVSASLGKAHTLILTDTGTVFAMGENKMGQLGLGHQHAMVTTPTQIKQSGPPICRVACGGEFSMIVDIKGNLYSFGCPEYGQTGHNSDGKYFITSTKQTFNCELTPRRVAVYIEKLRDGRINPVIDVEVREVCCGPNHTVIIDHKRRVFSWGFGGYGRLGHNEQKDEMVPRQIKMLDNRNIVQVMCGMSFGLAHSDTGMLYFWGKNKTSGEATMYPKMSQDVQGWKVRSMGASYRSIVVAADESLVSWGPSPTYGELCYGGDGRIKSSTTAKEVKPLEGIYIHKVSCGMSHTLLIARNDTEEERKKIEQLPVFKG